MKKKIVTTGIALFTATLCAAQSSSLESKIDDLQKQIDTLKQQQAEISKEQNEQGQSIVDELSSLRDAIYVTPDPYSSYSDLGQAASKVYNSKSFLSIGGYGEYSYKKFFGYKNASDGTTNETRNKSEFNVVRFVPYIGFRFNDWIVMNTEIEFEDGGARSDNTQNYKYAIVEFSYLDFLFYDEFALRAGYVLVPFGITNLNHEPNAYLTAYRPTVETMIIPSTWHTWGLLFFGEVGDFKYYAGAISSPDAGKFEPGRFIQNGRNGARQFTDDVGGVLRATYDITNGLNVGGSFYYGGSSVLHQERPGVDISGHTQNLHVNITMAELHATYKNYGWNITAMAANGWLEGDLGQLPNSVGEGNSIPNNVNGQYLTLAYDLFHPFSTLSKYQLYAVADIEHLDNIQYTFTDTFNTNKSFMQYTAGLTFFPIPQVPLKLDYTWIDYPSSSKVADEEALMVQLGFIF